MDQNILGLDSAITIIWTDQDSSSLELFLEMLMSREASLSLTDETIDSQRLRPIDGVLNESMNDEPKSPIVINFKKGLKRIVNRW